MVTKPLLDYQVKHDVAVAKHDVATCTCACIRVVLSINFSMLLIGRFPLVQCIIVKKEDEASKLEVEKQKNILLRGDCSYKRMLTKCVQEHFSEEDQKKYDFYIADARGAAVWSGDSFAMDLESSGGRTRECEWTLEQYIKLSRMKYPSKARFNCVKREKGCWLVIRQHQKLFKYILQNHQVQKVNKVKLPRIQEMKHLKLLKVNKVGFVWMLCSA